MSSNDKTDEKKGEKESKALDFKKGKKSGTAEKEQKVLAVKPKQKITVGWIFGMIVLLLIAVSFVMAPAIQAFVGPKNADGIVFGKGIGKSKKDAEQKAAKDAFRKQAK